MGSSRKSGISPEEVLTASVIQAAKQLGIRDEVLANILGMRETDIVGIKNGKRLITHDTRSFKIGIEFVHLYRLLTIRAMDNEIMAQEWLNNPNGALGDVPLCLIQDFAGLHHVIDYLKRRKFLT